MELRGSGSLFGYRQSGGSGSVGYEMYTRLIQRTIHESGDLESGFLVLPEEVEMMFCMVWLTALGGRRPRLQIL